MAEELETVAAAFDDEAGIGTLTLDRPDALNAINAQLQADIVEGLERLERENEDADGVALRAVVVEGAGERAFSAGADIDGFSERSAGGSSARSPGAFIRAFPAPVIAKIRGYCLGGGLELALACDLRYAGEDSTFGFPEVGLEIVPGAGGIQYVARLASPAVAKELVMTAERFDAARAADEGLITNVVATDDLDAGVRSVAERIASQAPLAVQAAKASAEYGMRTGVTEAVESDNRRATTLLDTEDAAKGRAAFAEDRDPEFVGR